MFCPRCGAEHSPNQAFCAKCGAALVAAEKPQSVSIAASAPAAPAVTEPPPAPQPATEPPPPTAPPAPQSSAAPQPSTLMHPIPDGGFTIEDIVAWLQSEGYSAKVVIESDGDRHIVSNTQGSPCNVFLHDRKGDRGASIGIATGFTTNGKFDISQMNDWNSNNRWCRAYYDSVNDPWLVMDIDLWPGGTYESLRDQFGAWNNTLDRFIRKYDLR